MCLTNIEKILSENTKGLVGLDLVWKYNVKIFPAKKLASDWLI